MPTINISIADLFSLLGMKEGKIEDLLPLLPLVKGEIKDISGDEMRLELCDTNRPDLWCVEGVARQMGFKIHPERGRDIYRKGDSDWVRGEIIVSEEMKDIRPFIGAFVVQGINVTENLLQSLIETQEKLCDSYGRRRERVAIGIYSFERITFPVHYRGFKPDGIRFTPLKFDSPMTLLEILERHPKGQEFGHLIRDLDLFPILIDSKGVVLSMPPIINSREAGEVGLRDRALFVEATGFEARVVTLALNILASNLIDRGGTIEPVRVLFPYDTDLGREIIFPFPEKKEKMTVTLELIKQTLGIEVSAEEVEERLREYGVGVSRLEDGETFELTAPPYRDDYLHPVDGVEDFAISYGYDNIPPLMPEEFTIGGISLEREFSDALREVMIGAGYEEVISNILTSPILLQQRMNLGKGNDPIRIRNVMSETYSALRNSLLPSLLLVESSSSKAVYPHRIFEEGEVVVKDPSSPYGTKTLLFLSALSCHKSANLTDVHQVCAMIFSRVGLDFVLSPTDEYPFVIEGRGGDIETGGVRVGLIGEFHPLVLEQWEIRMPCSFFELDLSLLIKVLKDKGR